MREYKYLKISSALLVLLISTLLIGCGSSRPAPEEVIAKAQLAMEEAETYRIEGMSIYTENGETNRSSAQMEFVSPDRLRTVTVDERGTGESIRIGQMEYLLDADSSNWQTRQWPESPRSYNLATNMIESLGSLIGPVELEDEEVDGVGCFHYKGNVDMKARGEEEKAKLDPSLPHYEERMRALEIYDQWQLSFEFWVGKADFLLRQLKQHQVVVFVKDAGEETEREEHHIITTTFRFFDFNQPIQIEPPPAELIEGVNLTSGIVGSVGISEDLQRHQIKYEITVGNKGGEIARDIRVFVDSPATAQGLQTMEAEPDHRSVNLGPNEHETYLVSWEYDLTKASKEELVELLEKNVFRATWTDEKGQQDEKVLHEGG